MKSIICLYSENPAPLKYQVFLVYFVPVCCVLLLFLTQEIGTWVSEQLVPLEPTIKRPWSPLSSKSCLRRNDRWKIIPTKDNFGLEGENQEKTKLWKGSQCHLVQLSHETGSVVAPGTRISHDRHWCNHFWKQLKTKSSAALQAINSVALQLPSHYWKLKDIWFFHQFIIICPFFCGFAD